MSMKRKSGKGQPELWIATGEIARSPGHPFYRRLNRILEQEGFDAFVEGLCAPFYREGGRPSIEPGVYFRMLLIGYFEGLDSEREIAWRCADSLGLREFLGYGLTQTTPEHSSLSVIRQRLDLPTHQAAFQWVVQVLGRHGLLKGKTLGVDATTLEANAALRSIVRRDNGQKYEDFLKDLAKASGIETPRRPDLATIDRNRSKKGSNTDWTHPQEPEANIVKMKDGRTHLAHKAEHAVDMDSGAVVAVTLHGAVAADSQTLPQTLAEAAQNLTQAVDADRRIEEVVTDKGYHSNEVLSTLAEQKIRSYVSEPQRGRRKWIGKPLAQRAVYANRRRVRGERGKRLLRRRGELLERPFAHCYETGAMRRTHLRGHANILKRLLVHVAGCNLALLMRRLCGIGTPRGVLLLLSRLFAHLQSLLQPLDRSITAVRPYWRHFRHVASLVFKPHEITRFSTGC
jgi:transposase